MITASDFAQLRAFLAVGELASFSRAADRLGVTPSALSQMVRAFEERVGIRLLNRTTRSVALTDAGRVLFQRLSPAVNDMGAALGDIGRYRDSPTGTVRVHASRYAGELYLQPALASFQAAFPDVILDITLDDEAIDPVAGGFDAALRIGELIDGDMIALRLGPDLRQIAVAAPSYIERHGIPATPRDLVGHRCIRWRWPGHSGVYHWEFWQDGGWFEVAVDGPLIVNSKEMAVKAAIDGIGIAFTPSGMAERAIAEGKLVAMLEAWAGPFPGHHLCYPRQRQMSPALRAFIDHIRDKAASLSCEGPSSSGLTNAPK